MKTKIAIDPGASGGIVIQWPVGGITTYPMPDTEGDVVDVIDSAVQAAAALGGSIEAHVEQVGGYIGGLGNPGSAMFKFGRNYGFLLGVLAALRVPVVLVTPQKWQKALSLGDSTTYATKSEWKNHLKAAAQRFYPAQTVTLKTADALLILRYANLAAE